MSDFMYIVLGLIILVPVSVFVLLMFCLGMAIANVKPIKDLRKD